MPVHGSSSIGVLPPPPPKYEPPKPITADVPASGTSTQNSPSSSGVSTANAAPPTAVYRVGVGDIIDIRLVNGMGKDFTLFTVLANGTIDYPLAGEPVGVLNLTTDEIGARLSAALKRRGIFDRAQFQIAVRDYASHNVLISGLVEQPGQKVLRREAVPLYVVLAEASPRADAGRVVVISRATGATKTLDLSDSNALNELVSNGDVINVQPRPQEFFYIAGLVGAPGQKDFHSGMTLTQAILAAGGVGRGAGNRTIVTVSRQAADGRLVPAEYVLQEIEGGKIPDPRVQPGDRIEVGRRR
jgi:protein involved in polysaccharide export with SLBB domain